MYMFKPIEEKIFKAYLNSNCNVEIDYYYIIDFEFNGLPRYNFKPEISQVKIAKVIGGTTNIVASKIESYKTHKKTTAGSYLTCGKIQGEGYFTKHKFLKLLMEVAEPSDLAINPETGEILLYGLVGFSNKTDWEVLSHYNSRFELENQYCYTDIQESLMLSSIELKMAKEGRSMETCYYLLTGKEVAPSHGALEELYPLIEMWEIIYNEKITFHNRLKYFPWGDHGGMPLKKYCEENRRRADGYRYNNNDLLAKALDYYCEQIDSEEYRY